MVTMVGCCCTGVTSRAESPAQPPHVVFRTPSGEVAIQVEVASKPAEIQRGLMFRKEMGQYEGMLFVFPRQKVQRFWMKNTFIPLDMIFVNSRMEVVGVVTGAEPLTEVYRSVPAPAKYVVEVVAGFVVRHGVGRGGTMEMHHVPKAVAR